MDAGVKKSSGGVYGILLELEGRWPGKLDIESVEIYFVGAGSDKIQLADDVELKPSRLRKFMCEIR